MLNVAITKPVLPMVPLILYAQTPLPDFEAYRQLLSNQMTPAEVRAFMRRRGMLPYDKHSPVLSLMDSGKFTSMNLH